MNENIIIRYYQKRWGIVGAVIIGLIFLAIAMLQPIDGVPGYQLVRAEDWSIVWGFALSFAVGAVVGYGVGTVYGTRVGDRKAAEWRKNPDSVKVPVEKPISPPPVARPVSSHTLLDTILDRYPLPTRIQVRGNFSRVDSNFEFVTWLPLEGAQDFADDANARGFVVWLNTDASSAILYGAGNVAVDDLGATILWLRSITVPGQKGTCVTTLDPYNPRVVEFDSSKTG